MNTTLIALIIVAVAIPTLTLIIMLSVLSHIAEWIGHILARITKKEWTHELKKLSKKQEEKTR